MPWTRRSSAAPTRRPRRTWSAGRRSVSSPTRSAPPTPAYHDPAAAAALGYPDVIAPPTFPVVVTTAAPARRSSTTRRSGSTTPGWCTATSASPTPGRCVAGDELVCVSTVEEIMSRGGHDFLTTRTDVSTDGRRAGRHASGPGSSYGGSDRWTSASSCPTADLPGDPGRPGPLRRRVRRLQPDPLERPDRHRRSGLPGVIAHGMFTMALAGRAVTDLGRRPGRGGRVRRAVHPAGAWCPDDDEGTEVGRDRRGQGGRPRTA